MDEKKLFYIQIVFLCSFLLILPIAFSDIVEIVIEYEETGGPVISYEVNGVPVNFGALLMGSTDNPATSSVMITNSGTGSIDVSIRSEDFVSGSYSIGIDNCTYNTIDDSPTSSPMQKSYVPVGTIASTENLNIWFWMDVPEYLKALNYNSMLYINVEASGT